MIEKVRGVDMAKTTRYALTEAKHRFGELVKRSAFGGERFVLESRGKPQAAIVTYEDLRALERAEPDWERGKLALERLAQIREEIRAKSGVQPDSSETIRRMRNERDEQLFGLR